MIKKDLILLELLNSENRYWYGFELLTASPELRRGTMFIFLNRLAEKQLVEVDTEIEDVRGKKSQRGHRIYRITDEGKRVLATIRHGEVLKHVDE